MFCYHVLTQPLMVIADVEDSKTLSWETFTVRLFQGAAEAAVMNTACCIVFELAGVPGKQHQNCKFILTIAFSFRVSCFVSDLLAGLSTCSSSECPRRCQLNASLADVQTAFLLRY